VFHVNIGRDLIPTLCPGRNELAQSRFARILWSINLCDASIWGAPDAERDVERDGPGRDGFDGHMGSFTHAQDRALAVALSDVCESFVENSGSCIERGGGALIILEG